MRRTEDVRLLARAQSLDHGQSAVALEYQRFDLVQLRLSEQPWQRLADFADALRPERLLHQLESARGR